MKCKLMMVAMIAALALPAAAENIIKNPGFEQEGINGAPFLDWFANQLGCMPQKFGVDAAGQAIFHYICGCGADLGLQKPLVGEICPKCARISVAEETGGWYQQNADYVKVAPGRHGRGVMFDIPLVVGQNQGVRLISGLVKIKRDWPYELTAAFKTEGPTMLRVFVECYRTMDAEKTPGSYEFKKDVKDIGEDGDAGDVPGEAAAAKNGEKKDDAEPKDAEAAPTRVVLFEQNEDGTLVAREVGVGPAKDGADKKAEAATKDGANTPPRVAPADQTGDGVAGTAAAATEAKVVKPEKESADKPGKPAPDATAPDAKATGALPAPGEGAPSSLPLEKSYRSNVIAGSSGGWSTVQRIFMAPPRYKTDYLQVKLYAYMPTMDPNAIGKAYWDEVVVRPLTPAEASAWIAKQKPKKDKRFSEGPYKSKKDKEKK